MSNVGDSRSAAGGGSPPPSSRPSTSVFGGMDAGADAKPLPGGVSSPELARLLVSTHGKPFPTIQEILNGFAMKRELSGVAIDVNRVVGLYTFWKCDTSN